ncbi:hypothetical protein EJ05DRAFT_477212 [Pseudovirgaria hyperparasitica]|uniref:Uncharacterized protein n=1 Tax=Pseudovirgaria hyperparasitica TaxID=470096 RepID=A0A6A6W272_9PEZI|nr:uncharacterized protein EJ05DRAFT_477212 [Pseudovirgaria hyperparasitica]KAF2756992.1 hypothetical protein EJ05DRAFT_477212 [Pseudovirgaria hyperparasitica]
MSSIHKDPFVDTESIIDNESIVETLVDDTSNTTTSAVGPFPSTFTISFKKAFLPFAYYITPGDSFSPDLEPLMGIAINWGILGKPLLTLYERFDKNSAKLGIVRYSGVLGKHSMIELPAKGSGEQHDGSDDDENHSSDAEKVQLRMKIGFPACRFEFTMPVASEKGTRDERFEWRGSKGAEVKELEAWKYGFKLVRLDSDEVTSSSSNGEVVAAAAWPGKMSLTQLAKFKFLGSAERGELGEMWAVMAVMSFLRIMQIHAEGR